MKKLMLVLILIGLFSRGATGCNSDSDKSSTASESTTAFVYCEDPRPEICTMEYIPVCGELTDGTRKTYSTGCTACADKNVV